MQLKGKVALITGGASGLGAACVRMFHEAGGKVVLGDLNEKAGEALSLELGDSASFIRMDVTSEEDVTRAVNTARENFGGLQVVINCAGIVVARRVLGKKGPADLEEFSSVIHVNLIGTFNVIRLAAAAIAEDEPDSGGERGVIINTSSVAAHDGQIGQCAYSASKGGVASMTLPMARDLARHAIRVVSIAPGIFNTPMMAGMSDNMRDSLAEQVPFPKRLGNPEEFAQLAQQIIENRFLNGEVIRIDGGLRMP